MSNLHHLKIQLLALKRELPLQYTETILPTSSPLSACEVGNLSVIWLHVLQIGPNSLIGADFTWGRGSLFENTGASLVSWAASGLLPTNADKAHLSISIPSPLAQIYSSSDSRVTIAPFPPSKTRISWKITPRMSLFRNSNFKSIQKKKNINFCCKGLGKAGLKPYLKLNCNVCTKFRHIVKIKLLQWYFQRKSISCQIFLKKKQKQNKQITLAFETVICKEFHADW